VDYSEALLLRFGAPQLPQLGRKKTQQIKKGEKSSQDGIDIVRGYELA